jgi:hypothetical protein
LPAGELLVDTLPVGLDRERAAELDPDPVRQGCAKIRPRLVLYKPRA